MCAIIGWCGELPPKFLEKALERAQARGADATGIAWREADVRTRFTKSALPAHRFISSFSKDVRLAGDSFRGLAHTRRASPGMVKNDDNAHPFCHEKCVFAHNGTVRNYKEIAAARKVEVSTDSMLLGDNILRRDFTEIEGTASLVWLQRNDVRCIRMAKELCGARIRWAYNTAKGSSAGEFSVIGSTIQIIEAGLDALPVSATLDVAWRQLDHGHVYILQQDDIYDEGLIPYNTANLEGAALDIHTSKETKV